MLLSINDDCDGPGLENKPGFDASGVQLTKFKWSMMTSNW